MVVTLNYTVMQRGISREDVQRDIKYHTGNGDLVGFVVLRPGQFEENELPNRLFGATVLTREFL